MAGPEYDDVSSASQLSADLAAIDEASQTGTGAGTVYTISLRSAATLDETADLSVVNLKGSDQLVIQGNGATLDGGGAFRGLFVYSGTVSIADLTIQNAVAIGGNGGSNAGGGAGLGGGLFIAGTNNVDGSGNALATGGHVTLSNVNFQNNGAVGGNGSTISSTSTGAGGGGGLGGNGGRGKTGAGGGGGGVGRGANGGSADGPGNAGVIVAGASGGSGAGATSPPEAGGASGGGGGSGHIYNGLVQGASGGGGVGGSDGRFVQSGNSGTRYAGNGGFGGGGGSAGKGFVAGQGGFGGGGGGAGGKGVSGAGGFGGGGGGNKDGGFGGGGGVSSSGGGGLGAGGDIFVQAGGTLTIASGTLGAGSVKGGGVGASGGAGSIAHDGQAFATGIYLQGASGNSNLTFDPGTGQVVTVDGVIGDDTGSAASAGYKGPGTYTQGHAGVTVGGSGTLVLYGASNYTGTTTISDTSSLVGGAANTFSAASAFVVGKGTQVLLDFNQTIASLADGSNGGGTVTAGFGSATLTIAGSANTSFSGMIVDGSAVLGGVLPLTLIKQGTGTQTLSGANTYCGGTTIKGGILNLAAAGAAGTAAITFQPASGGTAELDLETAAQNVGGTFANTLTDFNNAGEKFDLKSFTFGGTSIYNPSGNSLTITDALGRSETFTLSGGAPAYQASDDGNGGTLLQAVCFCSGTLIRTAWGDVPVEELMVGDLAVTASGSERPIAWTSRRTIARPDAAIFPVRICAGAFGPNLPERDLLLSPGHPILIGADEHGNGGHLVPIMCLINGTTIERVAVDEVTYWHVELDEHDILLAEGLPAESYIDLGSRPWFSGADGALYDPDMALPGMPGRCRPVAIDGPVVEAERRRLDMVFASRLSHAAAWPSVQNALLALF